MARRKFLIPLATIAAVLVSTFVASPAQAHGYVSYPPSRQAQCKAGTVANCGDIIWEPQSVEAVKGSMQCNGGGSRFAVLNDDSRGWRPTSVGKSVTFTWTFTARHRTTDYEYFIGGRRVGHFSGNNQQPGATASHTVNLSGYSGRQKVLARWNVADTAMAFYACVDLQVN
jgi:chitin-binding protein